MKNIYKITKAQLISLWVFGVIGWFYFSDSYSDFSDFFMIFIPAILVFYTLGWKNFNKKEVIENLKGSFKFNDLIPALKKLIKPLFIILLIGGVIFGFNKFSEIKKEKIRIDKLTQDYNEAIQKVESLKLQLTLCIQPVIEKKYEEEVRSCNLLLNKTKSDYRSCLGYADRDWCIYTYDYESIDCSKETLEKVSRSKIVESDVSLMCNDTLHELENVNLVISEYTKLNKK